jgi:hypothetical protein
VADAVVDVCAVLRDFFRNPVDLPGSTTREGVAPPYLLTLMVGHLSRKISLFS